VTRDSDADRMPRLYMAEGINVKVGAVVGNSTGRYRARGCPEKRRFDSDKIGSTPTHFPQR